MAEVIKTATAIVDETGNLVAVLDAAIWPPINSVVEISPPVPVGTAVVRDVRLRVFQHAASIQVTIAAG